MEFLTKKGETMKTKITIERFGEGVKIDARGKGDELVFMVAEGMRKILEGVTEEEIDEKKWHIGLNLLINAITNKAEDKSGKETVH